MRGVFVDANESLAVIFERLQKPGDPEVRINRDPDITPEQYPDILDGAGSRSSTTPRCRPRSPRSAPGSSTSCFSAPARAATWTRTHSPRLGIARPPDQGLWRHGCRRMRDRADVRRRARGLAKMDRGIRAGEWLRDDGMQLSGKTLGLIGFGGIAAEVARIALGSRHARHRLEPVAEEVPEGRFRRLDEVARPRATRSRCICC